MLNLFLIVSKAKLSILFSIVLLNYIEFYIIIIIMYTCKKVFETKYFVFTDALISLLSFFYDRQC